MCRTMEEYLFMEKSFRKILDSLIKEYNNTYYSIPEIQEYKIINNDKIGGYFDTHDLYNKKYILYLSQAFFDNKDQYLKSLLFHELTHIYDSTIFSAFDWETYLYIMQIYSEVHASEIEMDVLLEDIDNLNVNSIIEYYNIPIYKFIAIQLCNVNKEFTLPDGPIFKGEFKFNCKILYYFIGFIRSLKKHNIECKFEYSKKIPSELLDIFNKITYYYLNNEDIDYEILYSYQKEILNITKKILKEHQEQYN